MRAAGIAVALAGLLLHGCDDGRCDLCDPADNQLTVTVRGLVGSRLTLLNNGATPGATIAPAANGTYLGVFGSLPVGSAYNVTVAVQPTTPTQTCVVSNGSGTVARRSNVTVACTTDPGRFLYTTGHDLNGIDGFAIDPGTGALSSIEGSPFPDPCIDPHREPSQARERIQDIIADPFGKFLFADCEAFGTRTEPRLISFSIDQNTGALTQASPQVLTDGREASMAIDPSGNFLYFGYAQPGYVEGFRIDRSSGALTDIGLGFAAVLGSSQSLSIEPLGRYLYSLSVGYSMDNTTGLLTPLAGSPFDLPFVPASPYDPPGLQVPLAHPSGRFLYVTGSSLNGVWGFSIEASSGALTPLQDSPYAAGSALTLARIDPQGRYLYAVDAISRTLSAYRIDARTGSVRPVSAPGSSIDAEPTGLVIDPTGRFAYLADTVAGAITVVTIDPRTGSLTPGAMFVGNVTPSTIVISN